MKTTKVNIDGITFSIPVGSLDKPTDECRQIMREHEDPRGWKYAVRPAVFATQEAAQDYAYCLDFYLGGHEMIETWTTDGPQWIVSSKGYYFYIGA